ncbi:hypothetical protein J6590_066898 [Homalodisca vitripennis]|nr:hypothetical protein J6590_066898 [Homalodisca vitripennis]
MKIVALVDRARRSDVELVNDKKGGDRCDYWEGMVKRIHGWHVSDKLPLADHVHIYFKTKTKNFLK